MNKSTIDKQRPGKGAPVVGRRPGSADSSAREHLLDAAIELFAERGIANTTVAQIAAARNVTSAMVHYWFESREKLLDAVVEERVGPLMREIWKPADPEHQGALDLLHGLLVRMLEVTERMPWLPSLWLREIIQEGGLLRERVHGRIPRERNIAFRKNIAAAQARGEINPNLVPELLFITMLGLVMLPQAAVSSKQSAQFGVHVDRAQLQRHVMSLLMQGLTGSTPSGGVPSRRRAK